MWGKKYFLCIVCCFALGYGQANVATESLYFMPYENTESSLIGNVIVIEENLDKIIKILDSINQKLYPLNLEVI